MMNDDRDQLLSSYDYSLPGRLIAQAPASPRDCSRLLVVMPKNNHRHQYFYQLPQWLQPGDLLVFNNTRVIPARLFGHKMTGAAVEILLLEQHTSHRWLALVKPGRRLQVGHQIWFDPICAAPVSSQFLLSATVVAQDKATGGRILEFSLPPGQTFWDVLPNFGHLALPPYVTTSDADPSQYQTVYAKHPGAIAAPTAGLHFTEALFAQLNAQGIEQTYVTLHVGIGTFRPVETERIIHHAMHHEWGEVNQEAVEQIRRTKAQGGRIFAVGTTAVRALETMAAQAEASLPPALSPFCGKTDLFIYPGYRWRLVDGLITNFHLPRSSLLMLVSALIGRRRLLQLYQEAIAAEYRFYSFGDAMLILPDETSRDDI